MLSGWSFPSAGYLYRDVLHGGPERLRLRNEVVLELARDAERQGRDDDLVVVAALERILDREQRVQVADVAGDLGAGGVSEDPGRGRRVRGGSGQTCGNWCVICKPVVAPPGRPAGS
jgi:hypothetical protein